MSDEEAIFPHECVIDGCTRQIQNDDEPWCFEHSPDAGSTLEGYSAKRAAAQFAELEAKANVEHRNVFEKPNDG